MAHSNESKTCFSPETVTSIGLSYSLPQTSQTAKTDLLTRAWMVRYPKRPPANGFATRPCGPLGPGAGRRMRRRRALCRTRTTVRPLEAASPGGRSYLGGLRGCRPYGRALPRVYTGPPGCRARALRDG